MQRCKNAMCNMAKKNGEKGRKVGEYFVSTKIFSSEEEENFNLPPKKIFHFGKK